MLDRAGFLNDSCQAVVMSQPQSTIIVVLNTNDREAG